VVDIGEVPFDRVASVGSTQMRYCGVEDSIWWRSIPYHVPRPSRKPNKSKSHVQGPRNQLRRARELFCQNWNFSSAQTRFCARYYINFPGVKQGYRKPKFKFKMFSFHQDLLQVIWRSFGTSNQQAKSAYPSWSWSGQVWNKRLFGGPFLLHLVWNFYGLKAL